MQSLTYAIGILAGSLTTVAFLPQLVKVWRTRSTSDISLGMFSTFCLGVALWLAYGVLRNDPVVIVANLITLILALGILFFKMKHG